MMVRLGLGYCLVAAIFNLATERMVQKSGGHILTGPDSLVDKASASGAGGRRFDSQCQRQWGSF